MQENDFDFNYHLMRPCIAGLEHGVLILFERSAIIEAMLEKIFHCIKEKNIEKFKKERKNFLKDMINAHSELEEVSALSKLINKEQGIDENYKELQYYVTSFSEEIIFKNQKRLSRIMLVLTVISLVVAIIAVVVTVIASKPPV